MEQRLPASAIGHRGHPHPARRLSLGPASSSTLRLQDQGLGKQCILKNPNRPKSTKKSFGLHPDSCHPDTTWPERECPWSNIIVSLISSLAATWTKNSKPQDPELVNRRGEQSGDLSRWVIPDSPVLAVPEGPALSLSQPGCDKPQGWSHLCKPTKFPAPSTHSAAVSHLCQLVPLVSIFLPLFLWAATPSAIYLLTYPADLQSSAGSSVVTHLLLKVFWVYYFSATLPRTTLSQNREGRKWGRADGGGGWGRNPKLLWKNSAEVLWSKLGLRERGHSKSNNGKETVLWLELHWEAWTHTR